MSKNDLWFGYLQAGDHSSPVVRDNSLESKSSKTIYLYNHARGKILEYSLEVVGPKLRDLQPDEASPGELKKAYKAALSAFEGERVAPVRKIAASAVSTKTAGVNTATLLLDELKEVMSDTYAEEDIDD